MINATERGSTVAVLVLTVYAKEEVISRDPFNFLVTSQMETSATKEIFERVIVLLRPSTV